MTVEPRFPGFGDGGYESFYLRAVDPQRPRSVWLRHTVHKSPGHGPVGSTWVSLFDRDAPQPATNKQSIPGPTVPDGGWIRIGDSEFGPRGVRGPDWDLRFESTEAPLRHLPRDFLYGTPLPKTKLESPLPAARFSGHVKVGDTTFELDGWDGMVGHNWGSQHAERWIWLNGVQFADARDAWLDLAIGRVKIGPVTTPWVANGVFSAGGKRLRFGRVRTLNEDPLRLDLELTGSGARLNLTVQSPRAQTTVWRYADPDGSEHHTANCSVATLDGTLTSEGSPPLGLHSEWGGVYELGMRETDHGLPLQPFPDP